MKTINKLIDVLAVKRQERDELKLWLAQKEVVEYNNWKMNNEKDRTAMDKVVAKLKLEDDEWMNKEQDYITIENEYRKFMNTYEIVKGLISRSDVDIKEINKMIENIIGE